MSNILSLTTIRDKDVLKDYLSYIGADISYSEIESLSALCRALNIPGVPIEAFDHYTVGYLIPQISKEFDLLRVADASIINIELKTKFNYAAALKQLQENYAYLNYLHKDLFLYTFSSAINKLYKLSDDKMSLKEVSSLTLIEHLTQQRDFFNGNLDDLFRPSQYLVSPFNATDKFVNDEYFLTNQQNDIKNRTLISFESSKKEIVAIEGRAGTGKSLLLYDIAKNLKLKGKKVMIAHTGSLNEGHMRLRDTYGYDVVSMKTLYSLVTHNNISAYDCLIIDEAQRMHTYQVDDIFSNIQLNNIKCVLGFDPRQILRDSEKGDHLIEAIDKSGAKSYKLTQKIRTNKDISSFIKSLFKLNKSTNGLYGEKVSCIHFRDYNAAKLYIETSRADYSLATLTPSTILENKHEIDVLNKSISSKGNAHKVIGQEFDNVIVVIDDIFYYSPKGNLLSRTRPGVPYSQRDMLFQIVTRTREKLEIVVVNNEQVFGEIVKMLTK